MQSIYLYLPCAFLPQMKESLVQELQQKAEETEQLQVELQMLETERVRLSLVEEKLLDVLQLLQHLRDLVSRPPRGISPSSFIIRAALQGVGGGEQHHQDAVLLHKKETSQWDTFVCSH